MSPRRPPPTVDFERFMQRLDGRFDEMLIEIGEMRARVDATQYDVRKGTMERELLARRLSDLELQVIETRSHLQVTHREDASIAEAAAASAAEVAAATPKSVWRTKLGLVTATSAAFVAVVAFFNNLPRFVRGASEFAVSLYGFIVRHK
jgi:hypothetical protein